MSDLRFALRSFAKNTGFARIVVATLALAVGANVAVFQLNARGDGQSTPRGEGQ